MLSVQKSFHVPVAATEVPRSLVLFSSNDIKARLAEVEAEQHRLVLDAYYVELIERRMGRSQEGAKVPVGPDESVVFDIVPDLNQTASTDLILGINQPTATYQAAAEADAGNAAAVETAPVASGRDRKLSALARSNEARRKARLEREAKAAEQAEANTNPNG